MAEAAARFAGRDVPRPAHWGGFRLTPDALRVLAAPRRPTPRPRRLLARRRRVARGVRLPRRYCRRPARRAAPRAAPTARGRAIVATAAIPATWKTVRGATHGQDEPAQPGRARSRRAVMTPADRGEDPAAQALGGAHREERRWPRRWRRRPQTPAATRKRVDEADVAHQADRADQRADGDDRRPRRRAPGRPRPGADAGATIEPRRRCPRRRPRRPGRTSVAEPCRVWVMKKTSATLIMPRPSMKTATTISTGRRSPSPMTSAHPGHPWPRARPRSKRGRGAGPPVVAQRRVATAATAEADRVD